MTDPVDADRAERLARLRQRGAGAAGTSAPADPPAQLSPPPARTVPMASVQPTPPADNRIDNTDPAATPVPTSRRRSAATTAKIVTVGASTTAVLGMMAGYGIADRAAASKPVLVPADNSTGAASTTTVAAPAAASAATAPPATAAPPQVVVVVIDGATGLPVSGEVDLSTLATTPPGAVIATESSAPPPTDTAAPAPAPVAAPAAVDLAVPAPPPPPRPAAPAAAPSAPAAAPAPAPQPEATSEGS